MENFENIQGDKQEPGEEYFKKFNEFAFWLKEQKGNKNPDALKIILDEIGPEELGVFSDYKKGSLTEEELKVCQQEYTDSLIASLEKEGKNPEEIQQKIITDSRSSFYAIILNRLITEKLVKGRK